MSDVSWEISLRAEQPIEGCELFPHAYVKIKSSSLDNPAKAKVLFTSTTITFLYFLSFLSFFSFFSFFSPFFSFF